MTTAEEIFTMAIHLMDQQNDATGAAAGREVAGVPDPGAFGVERDTAGPAALLGHGAGGAGAASLSAPHSLLSGGPGGRCPGPGVLPYALAAHLLAGEDSDLSLWFQRQYALHLAELQAQTRDGGRPFPCHMAHFKKEGT